MNDADASGPTHPHASDLRELVGHRTFVHAKQSLEEVYRAFSDHDCRFMAVIEDERVIGVCARRQIGMALGARYGFSLFARKPVTEFLLPDTVRVTVGDEVGSVLKRVFSRGEEVFYDDVLLVDTGGKFVGLIYVHAMVRLQASMLRENIGKLEEGQRVIRERNEQMENDLLLAREMQQAMLPQVFPVFPEGVEPSASALRFEHLYAASGMVSGDFFHVFPLGERRAGVFLCDVMGHGVRAALVTAVLRALLQELSAVADDPGKMLRLLNAELLSILKQAHGVMFASALYLVFDVSNGLMRHACAGHSQPVHLQRLEGLAGPVPVPDGTSGPALGIFPDARYGTVETQLAEGDSVVAYTDGLFEVENSRGEQFGQDRLLKEIMAQVDLPLPGLFSELQKTVGAWGDGRFDDDVCLLGVDFIKAVKSVNVAAGA